MPPSTLTDQQIQGYRELRRDGVGAATAHRLAVTAPDIPPYRIGPDDQITFVLDERPDLAEFTITATSVPDPAPDTSWLGTFHRLGPRGWRPPETIELADSLGSYFMPAYSLAQRRADLSARGYARGPAHMLAERGVRDDAQLALALDCCIVTVEVRKVGVHLGTASIGTDFRPDECPDHALATAVADHDLIEEAVSDARARLPVLLTALAD